MLAHIFLLRAGSRAVGKISAGSTTDSAISLLSYKFLKSRKNYLTLVRISSKDRMLLSSRRQSLTRRLVLRTDYPCNHALPIEPQCLGNVADKL